MTIAYRSVILSFCPDLTKGDEKLIPWASFLIGQLDGKIIFSIHSDKKSLPKLDPISNAVIDDISSSIREVVNKSSSIEEAINNIDRRFMYSNIHISFVSDLAYQSVHFNTNSEMSQTLQNQLKKFKQEFSRS